MSEYWVQVDHFACCNRCGAKDVAWQQGKNDRWYLANARRRDGIIEADRCGFHQCGYTPPPHNDVPRSHAPACATEQVRWMQEVVAAGYRTLALKHHPDHGGSTTDMQNLNIAVEKLRRMGSA